MIKFLAAVFMCIDHTGLVFFPQYEIMRLVGRLSMPLFAYALARGYDHSRMKYGLPRYFFRLMIFAIVSQLPYRYLVQDGKTLNIGATWLAGLAVLVALDMRRWKAPDFLTKYFAVCGFAVGCLITLGTVVGVVHVDFGVYGIFLPAAFYVTIVKQGNYYKAFTFMAALWGVYTLLYGGNIANAFGLFAIPLIAVIERTHIDGVIRLPKLTYYIFYPAHIALLVICQLIL